MATEENAEQKETTSGLQEEGSSEEEGVLLYYKFVQILEPEKIKSWLFDLSSSLGLLGRIRVAPAGINVTVHPPFTTQVGGKMTSLHEHIKVVGSDPMFEGSDFKLALSLSPVNHYTAAECGFTSLSARIVKELVTLGLPLSVELPTVANAGKHITAQEFHEILQAGSTSSEADLWCNAALGARTRISNRIGTSTAVSLGTFSGSASCADETGNRDEGPLTKPSQDLEGMTVDEIKRDVKKTLVIDIRNLYETRIGKFSSPKGVEFMDPTIRQYSDLPRWIDEHEGLLRNKKILMYCTGGVRCEMASAYIRSKGKEFGDVLQLSGGIQRYLEAFPDGGYFVGKNFVFDHRMAVPSSNQEVVGSCLLCNAPFDDYSNHCRCSLCRMRVLVCSDCQISSVRVSGAPNYVCELCSKEKNTLEPRRQILQHGCQQSGGTVLSYKSEEPLSHRKGAADNIKERKLKILCLHGFRQSASCLKGRLNALRKKLRHKVEFVYVDAPHEISLFNVFSQEESIVSNNARMSDQSTDHLSSVNCVAHDSNELLRTEKRTVSKKFAWLISPTTGASGAATTRPKGMVDRPDVIDICADPDTQPSIASTTALTLCQGTLEHSLGNPNSIFQNVARPDPTTVLQHQTQTEGWSRSWDHLKGAFIELGPIDGVLGFSQGAAVAAALCTLRRTIIDEQTGAEAFRFVILCSGFCSPGVEHILSSSSTMTIDCPSMHVFGGRSGLDRQIGAFESEKLASLFRSDKRMIVGHNSGHIIPTQPEFVQQYLKFLNQFQ